MNPRILALAFLVAAMGTVAARDHREPQSPIYPKAESLYIKRFTTPQVHCGTCFGYYKTAWRSWSEACNEPEIQYSNSTPEGKPALEKAPDPKLSNPDVKPTIPDVKPLDPKPIDPKPADLKPMLPRVPDPVPLPDPKGTGPGKSSFLPVPVPATPVSISVPVPEAPPAPPVPTIPLIPTLPQVNVK